MNARGQGLSDRCTDVLNASVHPADTPATTRRHRHVSAMTSRSGTKALLSSIHSTSNGELDERRTQQQRRIHTVSHVQRSTLVLRHRTSCDSARRCARRLRRGYQRRRHRSTCTPASRCCPKSRHEPPRRPDPVIAAPSSRPISTERIDAVGLRRRAGLDRALLVGLSTARRWRWPRCPVRRGQPDRGAPLRRLVGESDAGSHCSCC